MIRFDLVQFYTYTPQTRPKLIRFWFGFDTFSSVIFRFGYFSALFGLTRFDRSIFRLLITSLGTIILEKIS